MAEVSLDELIDKVGSVYKLINIASQRTFELAEGSPRLVSKKTGNPSQIALEEIKEGKISYKPLEKEKGL